MKAKVKLLPGKPGTKSLIREYGDRLVCVRYRYDEEKGMRYTTAEIIVEKKRWNPPADKNRTVMVRIDFEEHSLQEAARKRGGRWNPKKKRWTLPFQAARDMGIQDRIEEL